MDSAWTKPEHTNEGLVSFAGTLHAAAETRFRVEGLGKRLPKRMEPGLFMNEGPTRKPGSCFVPLFCHEDNFPYTIPQYSL